MAALQYVDVPDYKAIIFRRTFPDLALPGAIMDRAAQWLRDKPGVRPVGGVKEWHFETWKPGHPAVLMFGYLQNENDKYRYQGAEFQFIAFDELTQFTETQYRYLFSRLRRVEGVNVPLRMRAASNPGGVGHEWVKRRFIIEGPSHGRVFIPAKLEDNPHLSREEYEASLRELDPVTWAQLRHGDWNIRPAGHLFKPEWLQGKFVDHPAPANARRVRWWDLAATKDAGDYTVGARLAHLNGETWVEDVVRGRWSPAEVEAKVRLTAMQDGKSVSIRMEQEPGASGKAIIAHYARNVLAGFDFRGVPTTGSKEEYARPLSAAMQNGYVYVVNGPWVSDWLDELSAFPEVEHDDQVDATARAFNELTGGRSRKLMTLEWS